MKTTALPDIEKLAVTEVSNQKGIHRGTVAKIVSEFNDQLNFAFDRLSFKSQEIDALVKQTSEALEYPVSYVENIITAYHDVEDDLRDKRSRGEV